MSDASDTNERQFDVVRGFLGEHDAPVEVWEALDGLYGRYTLGKEMNGLRLDAHRRLQARVVELEAAG
jgi:hypothetical protein